MRKLRNGTELKMTTQEKYPETTNLCLENMVPGGESIWRLHS